MKHEPPRPQADWAYFLDMDGTLVEIAETPEAVHADNGVREIVERLHRRSGAVALVSGRALKDLEQRIGLLDIPMAGQHGVERRDASGHVHLYRSDIAAQHEIRDRLIPVVERHPGLRLEDKGASVALHYRQASELAGYVYHLLEGVAREVGSGFKLQAGKQVVELKPGGCDKGKVVEAYLSEAPFMGRTPVFIGDDLSDEHAFAAVNRRGGISIKVGDGPSCANYALPNVPAVLHWLEQAAGDGS